MEANGVSSSELRAVITAAIERRESLRHTPELTTYRLFHGATEGCPGLSIERYGSVAVVDSKSRLDDRRAEIVAALESFDTVVWKGSAGTVEVVRGPAPTESLEVVEHGLRIAVEPLAPRNSGIYLDARPIRAWLRAHSRGRLVVDLFCNTGALGVAAGVGGARAVTFVDQQKRALRRVRDNCARNGVRVDDRDLVRGDVYEFLRRCRRRFGGVIVASAPRIPGRADQDYGALAPLVASLLEPGGWMLSFFHHGERTRQECESEVLDAAEAPLEVRWRGEGGSDFPEPDERRRLRVTAFYRG